MTQILPRFTDQTIIHDPLAIALAQHEARETRARTAINAGRCQDADPADLRGIPCIARGVGGTSPNTDPLRETIRRNTHRREAA